MEGDGKGKNAPQFPEKSADTTISTSMPLGREQRIFPRYLPLNQLMTKTPLHMLVMLRYLERETLLAKPDQSHGGN
jgi:hypothetical protein